MRCSRAGTWIGGRSGETGRPAPVTAEEPDERVARFRGAAGRREQAELNLLIRTVLLAEDREAAVRPRPEHVPQPTAGQLPQPTAGQLPEPPVFLTGAPEQLTARGREQRGRYGFTELTVLEPYLEAFAPGMRALCGDGRSAYRNSPGPVRHAWWDRRMNDMDDLRVRPAGPDDLDTVLAFWRTAAEGTSISDDRDGVERLVARDPEALLLAERGGDLVGTVIAGFDGWRCHLYRLAVHQDHRRRGIGSALLEAAEERFVRLGGRRGDAMVLGRNERAQHAWRAAGYAPEEQWRRWVKPLTG